MGDLWRGGITPRRCLRLILNLPAGARLWHSAGSDMAWTVEEHMTASLIDQMNLLRMQLARKKQGFQPVKRPSQMRGSASKERDRNKAREKYKELREGG